MTRTSATANLVPFVIVMIGVAFSFALCVVPHFDSAHRLLALPFGLGVALYGIYGVIAALTPPALANPLGVRILVLNVVMGVALRTSLAPDELNHLLALVAALLIGYALVDTYLRSAAERPRGANGSEHS
jgi:prepilin signal peptidase PulO-like enzyme (type II secretory pathway)